MNGYLTTDFGRRLAAIGVPAPFRDVVISAVERGEVPRGGAAGAEQTYGSIVARVIDAAYGAFRDGLTVSLLVAGVVILAAGLLSWLSLSRAASFRG